MHTGPAQQAGLGLFLAHNATLKITVIFVHASRSMNSNQLNFMQHVAGAKFFPATELVR